MRLGPNKRGAWCLVPAVPSSVALLPGMGSDVRTPDKLVDGDNSGSAMHSWLAPLTPGQGPHSNRPTYREGPMKVGRACGLCLIPPCWFRLGKQCAYWPGGLRLRGSHWKYLELKRASKDVLF
jgi:hypothetical protein